MYLFVGAGIGLEIESKNVRHDCPGMRRMWRDGHASSRHATSPGGLSGMRAESEKQRQARPARKMAGQTKSDPRAGIVAPERRWVGRRAS
jgi:hypothetical protein